MQISINPKEKVVQVFAFEDISTSDLKNIIKRFEHLSNYEINIKNPNQKTNLIDVYEGNVNIDNLGNGK